MVLIAKHLNILHLENILKILKLSLCLLFVLKLIGRVDIGIRSVAFPTRLRILPSLFLLFMEGIIFIQYLLLIVSQVHCLRRHELRELVHIRVKLLNKSNILIDSGTLCSWNDELLNSIVLEDILDEIESFLSEIILPCLAYLLRF
jgi:hypothetical protein